MWSRGLALVIWLSGGLALSSVADALPNAPFFAMPAPSLRTNVVAVAAPKTVSTNTTAGDVVLTSQVSADAAVQRYEMVYGRPLLTPAPSRDELGGAYGFLKSNVFDPITDQEAIKVGKAQITGSVVNAIKRKNPLCLLHPLVFAVDW